MFSPRDAFVVPLECVSAFAVVLQGRIPATFAREEILAAAFQRRIPVVPDCVFAFVVSPPPPKQKTKTKRKQHEKHKQRKQKRKRKTETQIRTRKTRDCLQMCLQVCLQVHL